MRVLQTILLCFALTMPAAAHVEEDRLPPENSTPLVDLFERMLRGFMDEAEPHMRELERGLEALEPELDRFLRQFQGMVDYHPPEILPNGDIIIRRRQPEDEDADPSESPPVTDPFEL
ncbi:MAG: hypothetical protein EA407_04885 [Rhodobacteraceae bacterium]|nr:MAG: hypothetical protein EA407_04885 [Paracoccaceae bacterium]